jgi:recombination protein RecR
MVCVVAQPQDRMAIERTGVFRGRYHVLHGLLNPMGGVGPNDLRVRELLERLRDSAVTEVVVATSPTVEGDATALYLGRMLSHIDVKVTRIATGVAVGGELEYADVGSLSAALDQRRPI